MEVVEGTAPTTMRRYVHQRTAKRHVTSRTLMRRHATTTAAARGAPAAATMTAATPAPAPPPAYARLLQSTIGQASMSAAISVSAGTMAAFPILSATP